MTQIEHSRVKNPNWQEAHRLAIYKRTPRIWTRDYREQIFRAEKRSAQASAHPSSQAQGGNFLCVVCACLLPEFWGKCTRCERSFPVKHFYLTCLHFFFRRLKITFDSEQPMLKEKRIILSVWGEIKGFEHFQRFEYFFWLCIRLIYELISPGWIKTRLYSVISSYGYFFYMPRFITFAEPALSLSSVKEPYCCYNASEWTNLCAY